jgi:hypothetical protein
VAAAWRRKRREANENMRNVNVKENERKLMAAMKYQSK